MNKRTAHLEGRCYETTETGLFCFSLPVTDASRERRFSKLNITKTYSRSSTVYRHS
jgi:hypothetical protein